MDYDPAALLARLAEAQEELRLSADLAEQVDLHAATARRKIAEARVEFEKLMADIGRASLPGGKRQQS